MVNKVPLADFWENIGATLKKEREWEIPSLFKDFASECQAVRKDVGFLDLSFRGKIEVTGRDRVSFLHSLLTNDIKSLGLGGGCYAALLNAQGKILGDMSVYVFANSILLEMEGGLEKKILGHLQKLHVTEDIELRDVTSQWILLSLQGPKSEALVGSLIHGPVMVNQEFHHTNFSILETPATLIRRSLTGEKGFHLVIPKEKGEPIAKRILEVGRLYGLRPVGSVAYEILRIEAGIPRYGVDMDETVIFSETGLEKISASETKGCYPGQEVVARIKTYGGLNRKLVGLVFEKSDLPRTGDKVLSGDQEIGQVTSACHSPSLGKGIALTYLKKGFFDADLDLVIWSSPKTIPAKTTTLPFYKIS
ncbi:MAG: aminomethyl transferase family protein [Candidatus Omnitrophica bacterium]|nr:aminomethyl transferase family protein [Candidatus Omnitrophota bacterium]